MNAVEKLNDGIMQQIDEITGTKPVLPEHWEAYVRKIKNVD
jgi:hypothetical protein